MEPALKRPVVEDITKGGDAESTFRFMPAITRPPSWTGLTGRIQSDIDEALALHSPGELKNVDVYVCGLEEMVEDVRRELNRRGFDRKQIIYE